MKCEVCKKNDAQFYYKETINGKTTEKHLCAECAHKQGLDKIFDKQMNSMFTSFGRMMDSFLLPDVDFFGFGRLPSIGEMFEPLLGLEDHEGKTEEKHEEKPEAHEEAFPLEAEAEERAEEAMGRKPEEQGTREEAEPLEAEAEEHAEEAIEQRRRLNTLRRKMYEAIEKEDFEQAIELRDQIHAIENK